MSTPIVPPKSRFQAVAPSNPA
ncbi:hypothetical protein LINPERHAP1_LOCUS13021 [Linum perenne]